MQKGKYEIDIFNGLILNVNSRSIKRRRRRLRRICHLLVSKIQLQCVMILKAVPAGSLPQLQSMASFQNNRISHFESLKVTEFEL